MDKKPNQSHGIMDILKGFSASLLRKGSSLIDLIVFGKRTSAIASFVLALIICASINIDSIRINLLNDKTVTANINGVSVEVLADTDTYDINGIPTTVDITLKGDSADVQAYRQQGNFKVVADLRKCTEGSNIVDLKMESIPLNVDVSINPSSVTANLEKKEILSFPLETQLLVGSNQKVEDYKKPVLSQNNVEIKGSQSVLSSIRVVKAIVDATGHTSDFESDVKIVAYDADGHTLDVEILTDNITATVKMNSGEDA